MHSSPSHPFPSRFILIPSSHVCLGLPSGLFLSGFHILSLYTFPLCPTCASRPPISSPLNSITQVIFNKQYETSALHYVVYLCCSQMTDTCGYLQSCCSWMQTRWGVGCVIGRSSAPVKCSSSQWQLKRWYTLSVVPDRTWFWCIPVDLNFDRLHTCFQLTTSFLLNYNPCWHYAILACYSREC